MSVVDKLKSAVGMGENPTKKLYQCEECGTKIESYRDPERMSCRECMSHELEILQTT